MKKTPIALAIASLFTFSGVAHAGPEGGNVAAGQASIQQQGGNTTIEQSSQRAVINWNSFNIGANERVQHNMPDANSHGLHRVTGGGGASQLAGELRSNGNVYLINPAGVVIHKGTKIDVGGFLATTNNITDADFMAGNLRFDQPGQPGAVIVNLGRISVKDSGFAALVAPTVRNDGIIAARLGRIVLGSGGGYTLDFYGDELITFTTPEALVNGLYTQEGEPLGVTNNGQIKAEGGVVLLTASQLDGIVQSVVNNGGTISAASAELEGGKIVFRATGEAVDVSNTGSLDVSSQTAAGGAVRIVGDGEANISGQINAQGATTGGVVDISGKKGTVISDAFITAAGESGGLVRLGGEFQGGKEKQNAAELKEGFVSRFGEQGALASTRDLTVKNSTVDAGKDGTLIAWSEGRTEIDARLSGKYVETSGKTLSVQSAPTTQKGGVWLIDPTNVVITEFSANTTDFGASSIKASAIADYLNLGNSLWILADNSIYIQNDILYGGGGSLSLMAPSIEVANGVNLGGGYSSFLLFEAHDQIKIGDNVNLTTGYMGFRGLESVLVSELTFLTIGANSNLNAEAFSTYNIRELSMGNNAKIMAEFVDINRVAYFIPSFVDRKINMSEGAEINGRNYVNIVVSYLDMSGAKIASSDGAVSTNSWANSDGTDYINSWPKYPSITLNDSGNKISSITSNTGTWLTFSNLSINGTNEGTRIASDTYVYFLLGWEAIATIPSGTVNAPIISAPEVTFENGNITLSPYSIKALRFSTHFLWSPMTGVGDGPHIFGLVPHEPAYDGAHFSNVLYYSWLHQTVIFETTDGVKYRNGEIYTGGGSTDPGDGGGTNPGDGGGTDPGDGGGTDPGDGGGTNPGDGGGTDPGDGGGTDPGDGSSTNPGDDNSTNPSDDQDETQQEIDGVDKEVLKPDEDEREPGILPLPPLPPEFENLMTILGGILEEEDGTFEAFFSDPVLKEQLGKFSEALTPLSTAVDIYAITGNLTDTWKIITGQYSEQEMQKLLGDNFIALMGNKITGFPVIAVADAILQFAEIGLDVYFDKQIALSLSTAWDEISRIRSEIDELQKKSYSGTLSSAAMLLENSRMSSDLSQKIIKRIVSENIAKGNVNVNDIMSEIYDVRIQHFAQNIQILDGWIDLIQKGDEGAFSWAINDSIREQVQILEHAKNIISIRLGGYEAKNMDTPEAQWLREFVETEIALQKAQQLKEQVQNFKNSL